MFFTKTIFSLISLFFKNKIIYLQKNICISFEKISFGKKKLIL